MEKAAHLSSCESLIPDVILAHAKPAQCSLIILLLHLMN